MPTWRQSEIDRLREAITAGARTVKYADKEVTYHSLAEMRELLASMEQDNSTSRSGRSTFASFTRE